MTWPLRLGVRGERNAEALRHGDEPVVVAGERHALVLGPEKLDRGQVQRVERPNGERERVDRSGEDRGGQFKERDSTQELPSVLPVRGPQLSGMDARPDLVFQEAAGDQWLLP